MRFILVSFSALVLAPAPAVAQVAAESATIMAGTGTATSSASRSLGNAVRGSLGGAASAIRATRGGSGGVTVQRRSRSRGGAQAGAMVRGDNDPLEGTDAPTYQLQNGATIRVSGGLVRARGSTCIEHCDAQETPEETAPEE